MRFVQTLIYDFNADGASNPRLKLLEIGRSACLETEIPRKLSSPGLLVLIAGFNQLKSREACPKRVAPRDLFAV
jgi:hypothetical protein